MTRPCFLVVDREYSQSISTRKLVIETAKFNVLTAYDAVEALATVRRFPMIDGIVVDSEIRGTSCAEFVRCVREIVPTAPIVGISSPRVGQCIGADYNLESFDPATLLELLQKLKPEATATVEERNRELEREER